MTNTATTQVLSGPVSGVKFSADGSLLYAVSGQTIQVIDVATGNVVTSYEIGQTLLGFDVSPDGQYLSVGVYDPDAPDAAAFVRIGLADGSMETFTFGSSFTHRAFNDLTYLADGNILLAHQGRGALRLFDSATGEFSDASEQLQGGATLISSPDSDQVFVIAGYTTYIYTMSEGITANDGGVYDPYAGASVPSPNLAIGTISLDGNTIIQRSGIFDDALARTGDHDYPFSGQARGFAFSHDGLKLFAADPSGRIIVYDAATLQAVAVIDSGRAATTGTAFGEVLQVSPDGTHLVVISDSGLRIVNLALAEPEADLGDNVLDGTGTLIALDGNDTLGGDGYQMMFGGRGDDIYHFDSQSELAIEYAGEGHDIVYTQVSAESGDHVEELIYVGASNAFLGGGLGIQTIRGGDGNDTIDGGIDGAEDHDILIGGDGDDGYRVYGAGDTVIEEATGGYDTVTTALSHYELASYVERLTSQLSTDVTLIGNGSDNYISAYVGDDNINGRRGNDALYGFHGSDTIDGGVGDDALFGEGGNDSLTGGSGNDSLNGGGGRDTASYAFASAGVVVTLVRQGIAQDTRAHGHDTLVLIENLTGSGFDDRLFGDAAANMLDGLAGSDFLNGREGADTLTGGAGDDRLLGGDGNDVLEGGDGMDSLLGGAGIDQMAGGAANDQYYLDTAADGVIEAADEGIDAVFADFDYTLSDNVENLRLLAGTWNGTGNSLDNTIWGSAGFNKLYGLEGDDRLFGEGGPDVLNGDSGNDRLFGGVGRDTMTGGAGADRFVFEGSEDLGATYSAADIITDFNGGDGDRIHLIGIDAIAGTAEDDAFTFIGTDAFSGAAGELRFFTNGPGNTFIEMDVDGDGLGDMSIQLTGAIDLVASDFYF